MLMQSIVSDPSTHCQFVIEDSLGGIEGFVRSYGVDWESGSAKVEAFLRTSEGISLTAGSIGMFVEYLLLNWPFRKLYFETFDYNAWQFDGLIDRLLLEEARLKDHTFRAGTYHDFLILTLDRDRWETSGFPELVTRFRSR